MRVLLVSPLPPPSGGIARWTQLFLSECSKHGIETTIVNSSMSSKRASNKNRSFSLFDEIKRSFRIVRDLKTSIRHDKPDIIHICSPCSRYGLVRDLICIWITKRFPIVFHCHCNVEDQATTKISKYLLGKVIRKSKRVIVLNSSSKKAVDAIEKQKAIIIPNMIVDDSIVTKRIISEKLTKVIFVGHVKITKGISELFKVADQCQDKEFIVVGPVQELPDDMELPSNVRLVGEVSHEKVASYMSQADVFLFPSYTEGFANVMLEAMASGLPIIASDVGANKDMIQNKGGIIVPPKEYLPIISALKALEDSSVRRVMSAWNIDRVRTYYTLSEVLPVIKKCYEVCK